MSPKAEGYVDDLKRTARHALDCSACARRVEILVRQYSPNERYAILCEIERHEATVTKRPLHS